jgi:activator of HSP90 ATPase
MAKTIRQTVRFKGVTPAMLYRAIMNDHSHAEFSGGRARNSGKIGARFIAYDGYIEGVNLALEKDKRIVQAWRGSDWKKGHYSIAIFEFRRAGKDAVLTFTQLSVPNDQVNGIDQGWKDYYWTPMKEMFAKR